MMSFPEYIASLPWVLAWTSTGTVTMASGSSPKPVDLPKLFGAITFAVFSPASL